MSASTGGHLLASLPAVYRAADSSGDLAALLDVFEQMLFRGSDDSAVELPGIEARLNAIPTLFAPLGASAAEQTPDAFLPELARWLAFTPYAHFAPAALRRILADIVPLYALRGTRRYLEQLLPLCFGDEIGNVHVDDRPRIGFTLGQSRLGLDTRLARGRAFWFVVRVDVPPARVADALLQERLRALIDFAKPAHTDYELTLPAAPVDAAALPAP